MQCSYVSALISKCIPWFWNSALMLLLLSLSEAIACLNQWFFFFFKHPFAIFSGPLSHFILGLSLTDSRNCCEALMNGREKTLLFKETSEESCTSVRIRTDTKNTCLAEVVRVNGENRLTKDPWAGIAMLISMLMTFLRPCEHVAAWNI